MDKPETRAAEWKKKEVQVIKDLASRYKLIGIVDMSGLPAFQLLKIKSGLKGIAELKMARKNLIKLALKEIGKPNIDKMIENIQGKAALLFTNEDAFKIFKVLKKNIAYTKAKAGQIAPNDIEIKVGLTNFMAGPMIGELGRVGLKTGVEAGKIVIKEDKLLVKKGEIINAVNSDLLTKFGVEPMEVGLRLTLTYSDGEILSRDVLNVNEEEIISSLISIAREVLLFGVEIGYATKETVELMIIKGYRNADDLGKGLKIESNLEDAKIKAKPEDVRKEDKKEEKIEAEVKHEEAEPKIEIKEKIEEPEVKIEDKIEHEIQKVKPEADKKAEIYQKPVREFKEEIKSGSETVVGDVERVIEEEAKKAVDIGKIAGMNLVNQTVTNIIGGKTLNTNSKAFEVTSKPSKLREAQNQATVNFERDSRVAADFLRKVTDIKIKSQSKKS